MIFDDAKTLLSRVAILYNRQVDGATIILWQEILDSYTLDECMWALREFARNEPDTWLNPAHLVQIINRKRADFAWMNPDRAGKGPDAWLAFELEIIAARDEVRAIRATGNRLAVEAMEDDGETK